MSEALEELLGKVRAEALIRGKEWQKVAEILTDEGNVPDTPDLMPCTKTARPPECRSPSPVPRAKRRVQSPDKNPPKAAPVVTSFGSYGRGLTNVDFSADDIEQRSRDGHREQHCYKSDSQKAKVSVAAKGNVRNNDNRTEDQAEGPVTARSSSTAEESIELRIDRLLHACSAATGLPLQHALSAAAQDGIPRQRPKKGQISTPAQKPRQKVMKRMSLHEDGRRRTCNTHRTASVRPTGAKDLTSTESLDLISKVTGGIRSWLTRWPGLKVVWSQILQQGDWCDINYVAKSRKKVNKGVGKFVKANGGSVVRHEGIDGKYTKLYNNDGIHLSIMGLDVFNHSLQDKLERYI
ncbi:unnamed protein product [Ranitomeya imitator]|uniref:Uncharacterized protein n=1 Tax=Ranitomeya imitator TaxID=111125 RepID=A0ABN9L960_9NEOB|nr:unnamed protein product [Ranitomeya imitator]